MTYPNNHGNHRYWTEERVLAALIKAAGQIHGQLPCVDAEYNRYKKGEYDWPSSLRILEYFHSMARAWLAAGADPRRISLNNIEWIAEEDAYLLDNAGRLLLRDIAVDLHRSYQACRSRLKGHGIKARNNQGYLSAAELAREYNCSCHRIRLALKNKKIKGKFDRRRNSWKIDPMDIMTSIAAQEILNRPKKTWKSTPPDRGDYYRRYGLKRILVEGKLVRVPVVEGALK